VPPGSPFSNVLGQDPDDSTFKDVESTQSTDTTTETAGRPPDAGTEPAGGVLSDASGATHEAGQDETPGDEPSGTYTAGS
jgi:hypothetical protein